MEIKRKVLDMYGNPAFEENILKFLNSRMDYDKLSIEQKLVVIKKLQLACKSCKLHYSNDHANVPSVLNPGSPFLFIGRNPNGTESKEGSLYPEGTQQGNMFKKYLSFLGIGEGEISILNMCQCYGTSNRPATQEEINKCVAYKKFEMDIIGDNIRIIFPMGQDSLKWVLGRIS